MKTEEWVDELVSLLGEDIVLTGSQELQEHGFDWWPVAIKARQQGEQPWQPQAVVRPETVAQVQQTLAWANQKRIPVTPWGLGSGVTGAALSTRGGISLDMSALDQVLMLDEESLVVQVQAGMNGWELEQLLNQRGFTLSHSPQSLERSTVGGWIATRATGQFSSRYGGIEELTLSLTVVLASGELVALPLGPRASTGPDLSHMFMGSEGTLGVVVEVSLRIFPLPEHCLYQSLAFVGVPEGLQAMRRIMRLGLHPFLARLYDEDEARHVLKDAAFKRCLMLLGFEGARSVARAEYRAALAVCQEFGGEPLGPGPARGWMARRFDFSTVENRLNQAGGYAETIEIADFWSGIYDTYRALKAGLAPYAQEVLGHFSHVYTQGSSLYIILLGQAEDDAAAQERLHDIWQTAMTICLERNVTLSHHHGVGLARSPYIRAGLGSSLVVLERVKQALDPVGILNPGKLGLKEPG